MNNQLNISDLQNWYQENKRELPFRKTNDPYAIWISEIMLQQTKIETVLPYYEKFMLKYPNVFDLSKTTQETLLNLLEGIGYYRRFKHLLQASQRIVDDNKGIFPRTYDAIKALPGIGTYTTGAIMSIAYNKPYAATDGNVIRVLSRVYGILENMRLEKNKKKVHEINQSLIKHGIPNIYTQAMMELGALICLPRNPLCNHCPIQKTCIAFKQNTQDQLPVLSKLPEKTIKHYICLIIHKENQVILRKRNEKLLEGMFEYPQFQFHSYQEVEEYLSKNGIHISLIAKGKKYTHIFTHQKWIIDVYHVQLKSHPLPDWVLVSINDLQLYPMAKAHRQIKNISY